jgi:hypothetical protein
MSFTSDLGDDEVAAEVKQVERTQRAGDLDQVHAAWRTDERGDVVDGSEARGR